jgi:DNA replication and repair protein RecF
VWVRSLQLHHFRNYLQLSLEFSPGLNVIHGDNAQGKTNLLESIYFLSTGKSHRTSRDAELIQEGQTGLIAKATVTRRTGNLSLELAFGLEKRKQLKINGVHEHRIAHLVGNLGTVFFSPDDLQLVKGPPSSRRRFLDIEISQLSQTYLHHLIAYNRVVQQRNTLLKQEHVDPSLMEIYDQQLVETGAQIIARRSQAVARLAPLAAHYHELLASGREKLTLQYSSQGAADGEITSVEQARERLWSLVQQRRREEIRRQITLVGPHRDDLGFWISGSDARLYGSQGQQRTAVLALKLAELQYMFEELGEYPVLLLDDVASELDPHRRHFLLHAVQEGVQTFVSCTDLEDLMVRQWPTEHRLFRVRSGTIEQIAKGLS